MKSDHHWLTWLRDGKCGMTQERTQAARVGQAQHLWIIPSTSLREEIIREQRFGGSTCGQ
jgi:hypothetical protein